MATRKDTKLLANPKPKQIKGSKQKTVLDLARLSARERLPVHVAECYQVATGTSWEILNWLKGVPENERQILIPFPNEASYQKYGPIFWQLAQRLPEIVEKIQHRRFEQSVDALTLELPTKP
jgi:hypothetical protein